MGGSTWAWMFRTMTVDISDASCAHVRVRAGHDAVASLLLDITPDMARARPYLAETTLHRLTHPSNSPFTMRLAIQATPDENGFMVHRQALLKHNSLFS